MKFQHVLALVAVLGATAMFIAPDLVSAQGPATLVPCGTDEYPGECTVCNLVALGQNIMNFFVFASVVVATLLFVNAGVLYVFSPGNPGNISRGHKIFTNTLVGILIILSSWILIDFVMRQLVKPELLQSGAPGQANRWGPWNNILCAPGPVGPEAPELQGTPGVVVMPSAGGGTDLRGRPNMVFTNGSQVSPDIESNLQAIADQFQAVGIGDLRITEACPPSVTHRSACHANCTCVDATPGAAGAATPAQIVQAASIIQRNGMSPTYETTSLEQYNRLAPLFQEQGMRVCNTGGLSCSAGCSLCYYTPGTGDHFSIYGR